MNTANILGSVIFGSIGFGAFVYGKKQTSFKAVLTGVILMVYPYFIQNPVVLYAVGGVLTLLLFLPSGN